MGERAPGFRPELGAGSLTLLIVGSIIGSGIFFLPGGMLEQAGSPWPVMLAWVAGALIALAGGLMFAELGAAFPAAGGQYVFIREALGPRWGFLFSWTGFTVVQSGTIAAVAVALAGAADQLADGALPGSTPCLGEVADGACSGLELPKWSVGLLAVGVIWLLTLVNHLGVRRAAAVNNLATVAKLGALAFLVVAALGAGEPAGNFSGAGGQFAALTLGGFGLAVASSLFAYDGFAQATFVAAEVKDARRTVPRAILAATALVAAVYLLATFAYFHVLPAGDVSQAALDGDTPIASEAAGQVLGAAAILVGAAIVVSTFGTTNAYVLASARLYVPVAEEGHFPAAFGRLGRHRTPTYGLWYGAIWSSLLALSGGYLALANLVVFGLYVFYLVTVVAYVRLRRAHPEAFTAFRAPLRPLPALFFGVAAVAVLASYLAVDVPALAGLGSPADVLANTSLFGLLLIVSGLLVWRLRRPVAPRAA